MNSAIKEERIPGPWTFEQIQLLRPEDMPSEWVLRITDLQQLFDYYWLTRPSMVKDAFEDFSAVAEKKRHFTNSVAHAVWFLGSVKVETDGRDVSFVEGIARLFDIVERNQIKALSQGHTLYMRDIGSYTYDSGTHYKVLGSFQSEKMIFPQSEIRILKWPNGTHYYAKIGNLDVIVNDEQKWDTKSQAKEAATKFLNSNWKPKVKS